MRYMRQQFANLVNVFQIEYFKGYNIIFFICMGNIHLSVVNSHIWAKDYKINYIKTFVTQK